MRGQCTAGSTATQIHPLYQQQNWQDVVRSAAGAPPLTADDNYDLGMALAHLQQWPEARAALLAGHRQCPLQKRFPIELAGVGFQTKRYAEAAAWLRRALRLDPRDDYAINFLATVYFLQGNLDAALKYWNLLHKPFIGQLEFDQGLRVHRLLLDRAFAFAPASVLLRPQYAATETRLKSMGIFSAFNISLIAQKDGTFNAEFHALEQNGFGNSRVQALVAMFGGAFYETIYPSYFNLGRSAINFESLLRWDAQKRRAWLSVSGPIREFPQWRWQLVTDERNENWAIRPSFTGPAPLLGSLNLERQMATASFSGLPRGAVQWSAGAELSHRTYRNVNAGSALTPALLSSGFQLKQFASVRGTVFDVPEHRFSVDAAAASDFARLWSHPARLYHKLQGSLLARWFPQASGDLYEATQQFRAGHTFGRAPFDELFMLGVERDNDLWLRGQIGTRDGRKGSSPLGNSYALSNTDFKRRIYSNGLLTIRAGPWLDMGKSYAPTDSLAPRQWLVSAGAEARFTVLGTGVVLTYGRDLRSGTNAVYATVARHQ